MRNDMVISHVKAFAPATVANVGPGFDVFGFALAGAGDVVEAWRTVKGGVRVREITGDGGALPRDPSENVASAVAMKILSDHRPGFGIEVSLHKGLPLGSGMGSSSASAVAAAMAVNGLFGGLIAPPSLLEYARFGEKVACGSAHADNVAPALYGGFTIVRRSEKGDAAVDVVRVAVPEGWHVAVVHPRLELPTRKARAALPRSVPIAVAASNAGNAASLVAAMASGDIRLAGRAVMGDGIAVPARKKLIRGFDDVVRAALAAGAAGASISGAGPSLFALTDSRSHAKVVAEKMARAWRRRGIDADILVSPMGGPGARIIERS